MVLEHLTIKEKEFDLIFFAAKINTIIDTTNRQTEAIQQLADEIEEGNISGVRDRIDIILHLNN